MTTYILKRILLIFPTLFCIILVNFAIINLAPGDPVTLTEISPEGNAMRRETISTPFGTDERYLQFRERYGLTLPILFNTWPWTTVEEVKQSIGVLITRKSNPQASEEISTKAYHDLRIEMGDKARFIMPILFQLMNDPHEPLTVRILASQLIVRGGSQQAYLGPHLTLEEQTFNSQITTDNNLLRNNALTSQDSPTLIEKKIGMLKTWYKAHRQLYHYEPTTLEKIQMFFFDTRFCRYFKRVLTLDFGTLRNDNNKTVIHEVTKRFKYSLTLSVTPMIITLFLSLFFGLVMAIYHNKPLDHALNLTFLVLYAIPIFVVAPFLIEEVALNNTFPFTSIPIPISGFTSPEGIYDTLTSQERVLDILQHIFLPIIAIMYGTLAVQSRLARTAVLEVMHQDYVRTARAKGVPPLQLWIRHVGRNAATPLITSLAGSLGVILGGSLIVEILFEINGFGKFFYDAVINRDYNVIMFSTLAGSFLALIGYLVADIAYTVLDPRVTLSELG